VFLQTKQTAQYVIVTSIHFTSEKTFSRRFVVHC